MDTPVAIVDIMPVTTVLFIAVVVVIVIAAGDTVVVLTPTALLARCSLFGQRVSVFVYSSYSREIWRKDLV